MVGQPAPDVGTEASRQVARQECAPPARGMPDDDAIVVCGRRGDSPYRLPNRDRPFDPAGDMSSVMRERMSWIQEGDVGIQSCGPVGPSGWTGCMVKGWKEQREQTQWGKNVPSRKY